MKSRYWAFIVYPESVLENWRDELEEQGLVFAVSPLHDKDINPTGEKKKEHYHVLIEFTGPKTYKSVKEGICDKIRAETLGAAGFLNKPCKVDLLTNMLTSLKLI